MSGGCLPIRHTQGLRMNFLNGLKALCEQPPTNSPLRSRTTFKLSFHSGMKKFAQSLVNTLLPSTPVLTCAIPTPPSQINFWGVGTNIILVYQAWHMVHSKYLVKICWVNKWVNEQTNEFIFVWPKIMFYQVPEAVSHRLRPH